MKILLNEIQFRKLFENVNEGFEPTVEWMKQKYNEFNALYFDNSLPKCMLKTMPIAESGGKIKCGYFKMFNTNKSSVLIADSESIVIYDYKNQSYEKINKNNVYKYFKPCIVINSNYKAPQAFLENTLIHEMCHYYTHFNQNGDARLADKENEHHGQDFLAAAEMINRKSNGQIKIKQLVDAEEFEQYEISSTVKNDDFKICLGIYNGKKTFFFTKYNFWIKYGLSVLNSDELQITQDGQILLLLRRYRYTAITLRNKDIQAYYLDNAPQILQNAFDKANYITVNKNNINEILPDN